MTLFQFGRTIHCTCGARVGLEKRLESIPDGGPPRFLADAMLGRLARWLRVLGLDVAYDADISDDDDSGSGSARGVDGLPVSGP